MLLDPHFPLTFFTLLTVVDSIVVQPEKRHCQYSLFLLLSSSSLFLSPPSSIFSLSLSLPAVISLYHCWRWLWTPDFVAEKIEVASKASAIIEGLSIELLICCQKKKY